MYVQERYNATVVGVNATVAINSTSIGGFLPKTSGTISVVTSKGVTIVDALPVTAGVYVPLPFYLEGSPSSFVAAGGASGTLAS